MSERKTAIHNTLKETIPVNNQNHLETVQPNQGIVIKDGEETRYKSLPLTRSKEKPNLRQANPFEARDGYPRLCITIVMP